MMANRIARNREVAGVHYPSDSVIGKKLANGSFSIMNELAKVNSLMTAARMEWAPRTDTRTSGNGSDKPRIGIATGG